MEKLYWNFAHHRSYNHPQQNCLRNSVETHISYYELKACRCDMFNSNVQQLLSFQARKYVLKYSHKFWLPRDDLTISAHVLWPKYAGENQLQQ